MKSTPLLSLVVCLTGLWLFAPAPAQATTTPEKLDTLTILLNKAVMSYQMFKLDQSNPLYSQVIDSTKLRIRQLRSDLRQATKSNEANGKQATVIGENISHFLDSLTFNESQLAGGGYEAYSAVRTMYKSKQTIDATSKKLRATIVKEQQLKIPAIALQSRALAQQLQAMSANYIEQVASVSGSSFRQGGNKPINELANTFSKKLEQFNLPDSAPSGFQGQLSQIKAKWGFIEKSMIDFKHNTVPYLVYRYADSMVDSLLDIADGYGAAKKTNAATVQQDTATVAAAKG